MYRFDYGKFRQGQKDAFKVLCNKIRSRQPTGSIVLPPRYGKSDLIRAAFLQLVEDGSISLGVHLTPSNNLADQMVGDVDLENFNKRYRPTFRKAKCRRVKPPKRRQGSGPRLDINGEAFVTLTIQAVTCSKKSMRWFLGKCLELMRVTGKPVVVVIDEGHMVAQKEGESPGWGNFVGEATEIGCLVWLVTGTPFRTDGNAIPGFECDVLERERKTVTVPQRRDDELLLAYYDVHKEVRRLKADFEVPLSQAFSEGVLSPIEFLPVSVDWSKFLEKEEVERKPLHEWSISEQRGILRKATEDEECIRDCVCRLIDIWQTTAGLRHGEKGRQRSAMIFTNSDSQGGDTDKHALLVQAVLREECDARGVSLSSKVVTTNQGDGLLDQFREGSFDVAIVKQMGSVGFDCDSLKIVLDLSTVKTVTAKLQGWLRVANQGHTGYVLTLNDAFKRSVWDGHLSKFAQSGPRDLVHTKSEKVDEQPIEESDEPRPYFGDPGNFKLSLHGRDGTVVTDSSEEFDLAKRVYGNPVVATALLEKGITQRDFAQRMKVDESKTKSQDAPSGVSSCGDDIDILRARCNRSLDDWGKKTRQAFDGPYEKYGVYQRAAYRAFRDEGGWGCHPKDEADTTRLRRMLSYIQNDMSIDQVKRHVR